MTGPPSMTEEAKDATAVVVAPPDGMKIASVGLRKSSRDDDSPFAAVASALEFQDRSTCCVRRARCLLYTSPSPRDPH